MASSQLRNLPLSILPEQYWSLFEFSEFNTIQTSAFNLLYNSNDSVIIATPTGSGKTVLAEIAIIKFLEDYKDSSNKIVYISPLKALSYEKQRDFDKYRSLGIPIEVITGDSNELEGKKILSQFSRFQQAKLVISTVEKLDVLSRNQFYQKFFASVAVLIVDEIHLLGSEDRGSTLELLLTRIKFYFPKTRLIGLSATIPNVESIASWLNAKSVAFNDSFRPSKLIIKTIPYQTTDNVFRSKYKRIYKSWSIIKKFIPSQSLVFVNSRGDTVLTAKKFVDLAKKDKISYSDPIDTSSAKNENLKYCLRHHIGFHHAGMAFSDKQLVERLFTEQKIMTIIATSTLAWGINLPAKVVIIQDIEFNTIEESMLLSSDIHQMLGRAGRPQFDKKGYGYVLVPENEKRKQIENLIQNQEVIESRLPQILPELLLAEVIRQDRITKEKIELFLEQSLYWHQQHALPSVQAELLDSMDIVLKQLEKSHFIFKTSNLEYRATPLGEITNYFYISINDAEAIVKLVNRDFNSEVELIIAIIQRIHEFNQTVLRRNEISDIRNYLKGMGMHIKSVTSTKKILAIILMNKNKSKIPSKLVADSFSILRSFRRYWAFFHELRNVYG